MYIGIGIALLFIGLLSLLFAASRRHRPNGKRRAIIFTAIGLLLALVGAVLLVLLFSGLLTLPLVT